MVKVFGLLIGFVILASSLCFEADRTVLPDYPFKGDLFSGYLDIEGTKKSLHYVFVLSQGNPATDPVLLWLNGGPGCSSLEGFSSENGPAILGYEGGDWQINPNSWNKNANVVYIESPAGVGFSYNDATDPKDLEENDIISGQENLAAIVQFFNKFPQYRANEFYISGESYAGIYIPFLANNIVQYNANTHDNKINLKGFLVGNGVTDWTVDADVGGAMFDYAYTHALYGVDLREQYEQNCLQPSGNPDLCQKASNRISSLIANVNLYSIYDTCYLNSSQSRKSLAQRYRYTPWVLETVFKNVKPERKTFMGPYLKKSASESHSGCFDDQKVADYWNRADVKKALNVRTSISWATCQDINYYIDHDTGSIGLYPNLIKAGLRIIIFSGDNDMCVSFNGTQQWLKKLNLNVKEDWKPWFVPGDKNLGGMVTHYKELSFITIRGAGHMVPQKKPVEAFHMINLFLQGKDL